MNVIASLEELVLYIGLLSLYFVPLYLIACGIVKYLQKKHPELFELDETMVDNEDED